MVKPKKDIETTNLEEELRNMLLGNVKIQNQDSFNGRQERFRPSNGQRTNSRPEHVPTTQHNRWQRDQPTGSPSGQPELQVQSYDVPNGGAHRNATNVPNRILPRQAFQMVPPRLPSPRNSTSEHQRRVQNSQTRQYRAPHQNPMSPMSFIAQCQYLDSVAQPEFSRLAMSDEEIHEKRELCHNLQKGFQHAISLLEYPGLDASFITLQAFGSFQTGFATKGSDVDLALKVNPYFRGLLSDDQIRELEDFLPRYLERNLLDFGIGARLLPNTRVPILKVCTRPSATLLDLLRAENKKQLSSDTKLTTDAEEDEADAVEDNEVGTDARTNGHGADPEVRDSATAPSSSAAEEFSQLQSGETSSSVADPTQKSHAKRKPRRRLRQRKAGPLEFPKEGAGIQADISINFSSTLAIHNTELLSAYEACDPRVKQMVWFVKSWAAHRKINSSYSGTLNSYGYVLMVLHYLMNIARPPVVPNLQNIDPSRILSSHEMEAEARVGLERYREGYRSDGYTFTFWGDCELLRRLAGQKRLTQNSDPLGVLLRGFFEYYSHNTREGGGFQWTRNVISIRLLGGLQTKAAKEWTGAKTMFTDSRSVMNRYLVAIEDPFELDHNVARTVTHDGIVAIRDEFRRVWRILSAVGNGQMVQEGILDDYEDNIEPEGQNAETEIATNGESASLDTKSAARTS